MTDYLKEQVTAFPVGMIDPKIGRFVMNYMQVMFQGYLECKMAQDTYYYYRKAWNDYDEKILSRKSIRSYIFIAIGHDAADNTMIVADANTNNDFSDEPAWILTPDHKEEHILPVDVQYDRYADGKIYR